MLVMALVLHGKISLVCFILGLSVLLVNILELLINVEFSTLSWALLSFFYVLGVAFVIYRLYTAYDFQVAIRGYFIGVVFGLSLHLMCSTSSYRLFGWYMTVLMFFHWSEFFATAVTNPRNLTLNSYLLDHSTEYHIAAFGSFVEFTAEWYFFPDLKQPGLLSVLGLGGVVGGEILRKMAMWQAGTNFNHYVRHVKEDGHILVTSGVYGIFRHPSYVGWFYWSIATQVMIANPLCSVVYALAAWKFFNERILEEEATLLNFFGEQYIHYQERVGIGIPFVKGFQIRR